MFSWRQTQDPSLLMLYLLLDLVLQIQSFTDWVLDLVVEQALE